MAHSALDDYNFCAAAVAAGGSGIGAAAATATPAVSAVWLWPAVPEPNHRGFRRGFLTMPSWYVPPAPPIIHSPAQEPFYDRLLPMRNNHCIAITPDLNLNKNMGMGTLRPPTPKPLIIDFDGTVITTSMTPSPPMGTTLLLPGLTLALRTPAKKHLRPAPSPPFGIVIQPGRAALPGLTCARSCLRPCSHPAMLPQSLTPLFYSPPPAPPTRIDLDQDITSLSESESSTQHSVAVASESDTPYMALEVSPPLLQHEMAMSIILDEGATQIIEQFIGQHQHELDQQLDQQLDQVLDQHRCRCRCSCCRIAAQELCSQLSEPGCWCRLLIALGSSLLNQIARHR